MTDLISSKVLTIGPLHGGGLVLHWRCPSECRHCLYACGPHRNDGAPPDERSLEELLDLLAERAPNARWHIGGGEPFLDLSRLKQAITGMSKRGMALEYVETNAAWVQTPEKTGAILEDLRDSGLSCLLISVSPFHAEFIPLAKTKALIAQAESLLPGGAFIWIPEFFNDLHGVDANKTLNLDEFISGKGKNYSASLALRYHLVTGGRTGRFLANQGHVSPTESFFSNLSCSRRLTDTSHFHVDCEGNFVPGLCSGLALPMKSIPGKIDLEKYPVLELLAQNDLKGLFGVARNLGFKMLPGYSSACDLCTHIRTFLFRKNPSAYPELSPSGFYDSLSIKDFKEAAS